MEEDKEGSLNGDPEENKNESEDFETGDNTDNATHGFKRRRKVKVRKRVRVKKKSSPRKRARKLLETIIWICVIGAFITTLVMLIAQMDLKSNKPTPKKTTQILHTSISNIT